MRLDHFVAFASCVASPMVLGCGSDSTPADAGPFVSELACPKPGSFPFVTSDFDWQVEANERGPTLQPRIKHQPADILSTVGIGAAYTDVAGNAPLVTGNHLVRGIVARIEAGRGGFANAIPEEFVSAWEYSDATGWVELGMQTSSGFSSATPGGFSIETTTSSLSAESVIRYSVLNAEGSCAVHHAYELDPGRKVVLADIDATLTVSDEEILNQIPDAAYDPIEMGSSVDLTQAWAAKGYQLVYLTARPHIFRIETREWLKSHGYPDGPVITAPDFVFNEAARTYKGQWVSRVKNELQWDIVAAYGNAESDIDGYEDAGIDKDVTFIIGPEAGTKGTVAIENLDYATHITDYVTMQPDAS